MRRVSNVQRSVDQVQRLIDHLLVMPVLFMHIADDGSQSIGTGQQFCTGWRFDDMRQLTDSS
jgi:hypothetical protein